MAARDAVRRLAGRAAVRDADEEHRSSTPLELFFDLTYVVAVSRAAQSLHHQLAAGDVGRGLLGFSMAFFAVWWGWMNYTWFASAHDSDDIAHRLLTFVQITGVLIFAAGVPEAAEHDDFAVVVLGFAVMRVGLIASWLRVARDHPEVRRRALRFSVGLTVLQVLWIARLTMHGAPGIASFFVLGAGELAIPVWAEHAGAVPIFHADHIQERYGLFTIILLGESIVSAATGFQAAFDAGGLTGELTVIGFGGLLLAFAAWWLYFDHPGHLAPTPDVAFRWGYAHVILFAALAGLGAGLHLATQSVGAHAEAPPRTAALAVAVPTAGFLLGLVVVLLVTGASVLAPRVWPKVAGAMAALAIGAVASVPVAVVGCALVLTGLAAAMVLDGTRVHPAAERLR